MYVFAQYIMFAVFCTVQSCTVKECYCAYEMLDCSHLSLKQVPNIKCNEIDEQTTKISFKNNKIGCPKKRFIAELSRCLQLIDFTNNPLNCSCINTSDSRVLTDCVPPTSVTISTSLANRTSKSLVSTILTQKYTSVVTSSSLNERQLVKTAQWILQTSIAVPVAIVLCCLIILMLRVCRRRIKQRSQCEDLIMNVLSSTNPIESDSEDDELVFSISETYI